MNIDTHLHSSLISKIIRETIRENILNNTRHTHTITFLIICLSNYNYWKILNHF